MNRKICVVTGTRAEYGLLHRVMENIKDTGGLELQVIVTGTHLSPEFGLTYQEIERDNIFIDKKIEVLLSSDTPVGLSKSMGLGLIGFSEAFDELKPDLLLVLGDRYEIFSAVAAAMIARIPIGHISGGETTEGAFDEYIRHSITKMSHLHFVAANEYKERVIQLGEQPERVFHVGSLGVDNIKNLNLMSRSELEKSLGIKLAQKNLLITFHPVTLENATSEKQMIELLAALEKLESTRLIFTMPNADTESRILFELVKDFVTNHDNAYSFVSLGQLRYLSCIQFMDGVVGNSSSGLTEAPCLGIGTVNIGDRQLGRIKVDSVIDCKPDRESIGNALIKLHSENFKKTLVNTSKHLSEGGASHKIVKVLKDFSLTNIIKKSFYDLDKRKQQENKYGR